VPALGQEQLAIEEALEVAPRVPNWTVTIQFSSLPMWPHHCL
jgi:hypothetical protein